jgi:hypothetical protein
MVHPKSAHLIALLFFILAFMPGISAQESGDYRSVGSGNWTDSANWEVFDGTNWVAATTYPGEVGGTNIVTIQNGNTISLGSTIPNAIGGLIVGDGAEGTDTLQITNTATLNTPFIDLQTGGVLIWTSNVSFYLPAGAALFISGGILDNSGPCNASKRLVIGPQIYSTCNGGAGVDYTFEDLNNSGGSLSASPSSNSPVCGGSDLTLFANPSGAGSSGASFSWAITDPAGDPFSSTAENPVVSGLTPGTYTFEVTVTDASGFSYSDTTVAEVETGTAISLQPGDQQAVPGSTATFSVTASGAGTYQWQISTDGGGTFANLTDGVKYTGSQTASLQVAGVQTSENGALFRVLIQPVSASCPDVTSDPATLTVVSGTVVTNKRITYRVNN